MPASGDESVRSANADRALRDFWSAAALAIVSGGVMMVAGCLLRTGGPGTASLATLPGGVLIVAAFARVRRQPPRRPGAAATNVLSRVRAGIHVLRNFGLPDDFALRARAVALSLTMIAGALMVFAGYAVAAQGWRPAIVAALTGGLLISGALATVARAPGRG